MMVAPGGRFLITVSDAVGKPIHVIRLWDLGYPGRDSSVHPSSVALMVQPKCHGIHCISITMDDLGLRLITSTYISPMKLTRIFVHEVYPLDSSPSFYERSTLEVFGLVSDLTVSGQQLACIYGSASAVVWDISSDLTAHWSMNGRFLKQINGLHIYGNALIVCLENEFGSGSGFGSFSIWTIPSLSQRIAESLIDQSVSPAAPILDVSTVLHDNSYGSILTQLPFVNVGLQYLIFLSQGFREPDLCCRMVVYKMDLIKPSTSSPAVVLPSILTRGEFTVGEGDINPFLLSARYEICDGNIVVLPPQTSPGPSEIPLFLIPIPNKPEDFSSSTFHRKLLIDQIQGAVESAEICPATGRFCILTADGEIRIINYLMGME